LSPAIAIGRKRYNPCNDARSFRSGQFGPDELQSHLQVSRYPGSFQVHADLAIWGIGIRGPGAPVEACDDRIVVAPKQELRVKSFGDAEKPDAALAHIVRHFRGILPTDFAGGIAVDHDRARLDCCGRDLRGYDRVRKSRVSEFVAGHDEASRRRPAGLAQYRLMGDTGDDSRLVRSSDDVALPHFPRRDEHLGPDLRLEPRGRRDGPF
jgi:hypothetical protein